jgi:hypothetical protein
MLGEEDVLEQEFDSDPFFLPLIFVGTFHPPTLPHNMGAIHQPPPISQSLQQPPTQTQIDSYQANMGMMQGRSNLISIPIQEDTDFRRQAYMTPPLGMPPRYIQSPKLIVQSSAQVPHTCNSKTQHRT